MSGRYLIKHEMENSVVTIKNMAITVQSIIERVANYCLKNQVQVATQRQFEILKRSMKIIEDESNKLVKLCNEIDQDENRGKETY